MIPPPYCIRDAEPADARALAQIRVASWRMAYAGIVPGAILERMDVARNEAFFATRMATTSATADGRETIVIEGQTEPGGSSPGVVGYALIGPCADVDAAGLGEIEAIYLDPSAIGHGLGRVLLDAAVERLRVAKSAAIVLWVLTDNDRARRFYVRSGFEPDGAVRMLDFDGIAIEEIRYRRMLPSA